MAATSGHFRIMEGEWLVDEKRIPAKGVSAIPVPVGEVDMVEFMDTKPEGETEEPAMAREPVLAPSKQRAMLKNRDSRRSGSAPMAVADMVKPLPPPASPPKKTD